MNYKLIAIGDVMMVGSFLLIFILPQAWLMLPLLVVGLLFFISGIFGPVV